MGVLLRLETAERAGVLKRIDDGFRRGLIMEECWAERVADA